MDKKLRQQQKIMVLNPKEFVDKVSENFKNLLNCMNFSNDSFIRTTEEKHIKSCQKIWEKLLSNGNIYLDKYSGWYAVRDEAFFQSLKLWMGKLHLAHLLNGLKSHLIFLIFQNGKKTS